MLYYIIYKSFFFNREQSLSSKTLLAENKYPPEIHPKENSLLPHKANYNIVKKIHVE